MLSPVIPLAGVTAPITLSFNYLLQTESNTNYDRATVAISTDGGFAWTTLATRFSSNSLLNGPTWTNWQASLSNYAGSNILLRFSFDTVDSANNNYEGWYVDDVTIMGVQTQPRLCLRAPILRANGLYDLQVDTCNNVAFVPEDTTRTRLYWSTNLVDWQQLPNPLVLTNGSLRVNGLNIYAPCRFFRAMAP